jgi:hypothetical protein
MGTAEILSVAVNLLGKAIVFGARWAATHRMRGLRAIAARPEGDKDKEIVFLRDRVAELQSQLEILRRLHKPNNTTRYTLRERFMIIFHITYFAVPRRRVEQCFGVARSTLYRWLRCIEGRRRRLRTAWNRTSAAIASLVWEVAMANAHWGRVRVANQLRLLGVFIAPSTVRNVLSRPKPPADASAESVEPPADATVEAEPQSRAIPAFHANHVWSADMTSVALWGLWSVQVLVVIDHFSRKLVHIRPLQGLARGQDLRGASGGIPHGLPTRSISSPISKAASTAPR